jgi:hypothetical protein
LVDQAKVVAKDGTSNPIATRARPAFGGRAATKCVLMAGIIYTGESSRSDVITMETQAALRARVVHPSS